MRLTTRQSLFLAASLSMIVSAACSPSEGDGADGSGATAGSGTASASGGQGAGATGGAGLAGGSGGEPPTGGAGGGSTGLDNPDGLPESSTPIFAADYDSSDAQDIVSEPDVAIAEWGAALGYEGPGFRLQPDPIIDPNGESEDSAGWAGGIVGGDYFPVDGHELVSVSYMFKVSGALLAEIAVDGAFWAHDQKSIDIKYHDPSALYGEGHRNNVHFGFSEGQVRFSHVDGGAGTRIYFGPDWQTLADEWVWVCHVIDMRGEAAEERYFATYMKRDGDPGVTRIGIRYEAGENPLQPYDGHGVWGFFAPVHGYWDDMIDRDGLVNDLSEMFLYVDQLRVMPGWPDAAHGPPF